MFYLLIVFIIVSIICLSIYSFFDKLFDNIKNNNLRVFLKVLVFLILCPIPFIFLTIAYCFSYSSNKN